MCETGERVRDNEELINFPCDIDVKIFIRNAPTVLAELERFSNQTLEPEALRSWTVRDSRAGRYLAITAVVHAKSRDEIDAFYHALVGHEQVIMVI